MPADAILKNPKLRYLGNGLPDRHIWHDDRIENRKNYKKAMLTTLTLTFRLC